MRKRRSNLPVPTLEDIARRRDMLRPTPNGGLAWRCELCGRYASSQVLAGGFRCRFHGGVTPRQRDPLRPERPPGRPMKHGRYSRAPRVNIQALVATYRGLELDVRRQ